MSTPPSGPGSVTRAVNLLHGDGSAAEPASVARIRSELEHIARSGRRTLGGAPLSTGDLVHEAYLKLFARPPKSPWQSRRHFYGAAARAMEQVLVDALRRRDVERRHAGRIAVPDAALPEGFPQSGAGEALEALGELEAVDPVGAEVVRLRAIAGLSAEQVASMLELSQRTSERKWTVARAWLHARMSLRTNDRPQE